MTTVSGALFSVIIDSQQSMLFTYRCYILLYPIPSHHQPTTRPLTTTVRGGFRLRVALGTSGGGPLDFSKLPPVRQR